MLLLPESLYTPCSVRTHLMGAVLCFPGRANDSLGLRDCCWGFAGEVNVAEARFQGQSSDAGADNEGDHECPSESRVPPALCWCALPRPFLTSNLRVSTLFSPGWLSWGQAKESAQSLILSVLGGCAFFCRNGLLKELYDLERGQK